MGRPSLYTEELGDQICLEVATTDKGLDSICESDEFPSSRTVYTWLIKHEEFLQKYARAKELQTQLLADQIIPIADTPKIGVKTKESEDGIETTTGDMIEHRRLQIDARKWLLAKLQPKKYGDKVQAEVSGSDGGPIQTAIAVTFVRTNGNDSSNG